MKLRTYSGVMFVALIIIALQGLVFLVPAHSAGIIELPQTGQTTSYSAGDDGDFQAGAAWPVTGNMGTGRFNDNGDGSVTDLLTGLMWTKNANLGGLVNFYSARNAASALGTGGYTDWRIPNILELESLTHAGEADTAVWLNAEGFTGVQSVEYWTSTQYVDLSNGGWTINLGTDQTNYWMSWTTDTRHYWAVRGGANGAPDSNYPANLRKTGRTTSTTADDDGDLEWGVADPSPRYADNSDGTMTDDLTGLMWTESVGKDSIGADAVITSLSDVNQYIDDMNTQANGRCIKPSTTQDCSNLPSYVAPTQPCTDALLPACVFNQGTSEEQCRSRGDVSCTVDADCDTANGEACEFIPNAGYTDWRLANKKEMYSLVNMEDEFSTDELVAAGFSVPNFAWCSHWTSTTDPADTSKVYGVTLNTGGHQMLTFPDTVSGGCNWTHWPKFFWPVRGGAVEDLPVPVDADLDGYNACLTGEDPIIDNCDCDDGNGAVNPGETEVCNAIDDNCDGTVDEGFTDVDGDGWAVCAGDCDDGDPAINPGATEKCNFIDDDCDGTVDGGADPDGDGVGDVCDNCPNDANPDQAESDGSVPGMRAYWKFDAGNGFVAYDTVQSSDGAIVNATWATGMINNALIFRGNGGYQRSDVTIVDDSGNLSITAADPGITIEIWAYGTDGVDHYAPDWATIGIKSSYGCEQWQNINGQWTCVDTNGDGIAYHWYDDGYGLFYAPPEGGEPDGHMAFFINHYNNNKAYSPYFTKNVWHHVAGTYDGEFIRVYVDGVEGASHEYTEDIVDALTNGRYLISGT